MAENVVTQNLRNFTVQIRPADAENIVGTGIVVSPDGKVVTCAHVVKSAGVEPRVLNGKELGIYFPQALGGDKKDHRAKVIEFFPDFDDDVVLLQLTDGTAPLGPEQMPVLGTAGKSQGNGFRSYGYRRLEDYIAGWAHGTIEGHVEPPPKRKLQGEPVQLESNQINRGMSGSPVLDIKRNLVIGIVSEAWFPDKSGRDSDTAWAVDSRILSFAPLGLPVQDVPHDLKPAPIPKLVIEQAQAIDTAAVRAIQQRIEKYAWNNAPEVVETWVGRERLFRHLTNDWLDPKHHVTGLIGFGWEGKSSLARKWLDNLLNNSELRQPDGIFWWTFTEKQSADEFLDAALAYISNGLLDSKIITSSYQRIQIIGKMLGAGHYIFVLDGLEWMQYSEGDDYGILKNENLRDLLTYFANPDNQSFCLFTSRLPLIDLMSYTTYFHRDVDRLTVEESRSLLQKFGVEGTNDDLDKLIADWDGHALTLSLLGSFIHDEYSSEINDSMGINIPVEGRPRFENVRRILETYNGILNSPERNFLMLLSLFYEPMEENILRNFIDEKNYPGSLCHWIAKLNPEEYRQMLEKLKHAHLLRYSPTTKCYSPHALVKAFFAHFIREEEPGQYDDAVEDIANYYAAIAQRDKKTVEKLSDLKPQFDVLYYFIRSERYDEAYEIYQERISQNQRFVILHQLGAYETALSLLYEFFESNELSKPLINDLSKQRLILHTIGLCYTSLGRLHEAIPIYVHGTEICFDIQEWYNASIGYQNLAELHTHLGALEASAEAARQALDFAHKAEDKHEEWISLGYQASASYLLGKLTSAEKNYLEAQKLAQESENIDSLYGPSGIKYAEYLGRISNRSEAKSIAQSQLKQSERNHWSFLASQCHRVLGDLNFDSGNHDSARTHYESALKIARGISVRDVLIEALLARGRFAAKTSEAPKNGETSEVSQAFSDLNEALGYCVESGYRIYEADVRVALAWAYLALTPTPLPAGEGQEVRENLAKAKASAERAGHEQRDGLSLGEDGCGRSAKSHVTLRAKPKESPPRSGRILRYFVAQNDIKRGVKISYTPHRLL